MNELSWLIYAAGVVDNLGSFAFFVIIGSVAFSIVGVLWGAHILYWGGPEDEARGRSIQAAWKKAMPVAVAAGLITIFTPSKDTVYAIAASELGESVVKSETGGKAITALNDWLDRQIEGTTK